MKKSERLEIELKECQDELAEQCRLLGMGGSRELRLMTVLEENKRLVKRATKLIVDEKIDEALELLYKTF